MTKENLVIWLRIYSSTGDLPGKMECFPFSIRWLVRPNSLF